MSISPTSRSARLHLRAAYYPEHWTEDHWANDIRLMREAGLTVVRMAEFAWSALEPAAGKFHLDWLDRAIRQLGAAGIVSVLGTPTAAPPPGWFRSIPISWPWTKVAAACCSGIAAIIVSTLRNSTMPPAAWSGRWRNTSVQIQILLAGRSTMNMTVFATANAAGDSFKTIWLENSVRLKRSTSIGRIEIGAIRCSHSDATFRVGGGHVLFWC